MTTIKERFFLFLVICIGSRLLLAYIAKNISNKLLEYMGYLLLLPAIGFIYIYLSIIMYIQKCHRDYVNYINI